MIDFQMLKEWSKQLPFICAQELSPYQQRHRLTKLPSLLEWLSFTFASGNLLAGPYFELSDYLDYMERRGPWDPKSRRPTARSQYGAGVSDASH